MKISVANAYPRYAHIRLIEALADSLAGRMETQRLYPLAQCENANRDSGFLEALFAHKFKLRKYERLGKELAVRIVSGGYPAALTRAGARRREW